MKARGYLSVGAGIFLVALTAAVWVFVAWTFATQKLTVSHTAAAAFLGQLYVGLAMIGVCGFLGIANGVYQIRRARTNRILTIAIVVLFLAALFVLFQSTKLLPNV